MKRLNIIFPRLLSNIVIRLLIAFILFLGVMLGLLTIGVVSDLLWKNIILAIVGLLTGICIAILYITIWQYRNANFVETSYLSLDYWIDKNDIGNASNLVKSLSTKQNTKQFKITPKYELLVKAIPEIVDLIDKETEDSLIFIKTYLEFEPKNKSVNEKILNSLIGIGFVGLICSSLKYGIDLLIKKETALIGQYIITWTILITIILLIIGWVLNRKKTREENARKFLQLVFKAIEEKE